MPDHTPPPVQVALDADPFVLLRGWLIQAEQSEPNDANAMSLATVGTDGRPSSRMVLLKGLDHGLSFFTNTQSRKGIELAANPHAALMFHWKSLRRQIRVEGVVEAVTEAEADAYFASRARVSRLGAAASDQSRPLRDRTELERRVAELAARYPGEVVPRPPHWSGFRLLPHRFEFWQDMPYRLHDRTVFVRRGPGPDPGPDPGPGSGPDFGPGGRWETGKLFP